MNNLLEYLSAVLLAVSTWWGSVNVEPETSVIAEVVEVIDGDTIDVLIEGEEFRVRYVGIDTPEAATATRDEQCFAAEAAAANEALVGGKEVELKQDVRNRDRYGRLLRYVYVGGQSVGQSLVASGHAKVVYILPDVTNYKQLKGLEDEARASGAGLWSACD